jgi:hypothetical protein
MVGRNDESYVRPGKNSIIYGVLQQSAETGTGQPHIPKEFACSMPAKIG